MILSYKSQSQPEIIHKKNEELDLAGELELRGCLDLLTQDRVSQGPIIQQPNNLIGCIL